MTKLSGEFQTDLAPPDALVACAQAIDGLGWRIESVEGYRIVSYAESVSTPDPTRIEVVVSDAAQGSDIRIIGSDDTANRAGSGDLVTALDSARDAIQTSIESAGETSAAGTPASAADRAPQGGLLAHVPLFSERPRAVQIVTAAIVPAAFGAITGIVLGVSAAGYWGLQLLAAIGGVLAGLEHPHGREGARRGLVGGTLFGTFLLIAHAVAGTDETVKLPDFEPVLAVFTALIGMLLGALGGRLRRRSAR
jgi:hypothetical protein